MKEQFQKHLYNEALGIAAFFLVLFFWTAGAKAQDQPRAYHLYSGATGEPVSWAALTQAAQQADVVFFGELHNNPIAHWLQLLLAQELAKTGAVTLGFEMFERDQQPLLQAYWRDQIPPKAWEDSMRLWPNYATDYAPLVDWAKQNNHPVAATNTPRWVARKVAYQGPEVLDTLPDSVLAWLAPLPLVVPDTLGSYQRMRNLFGGGHGQQHKQQHKNTKDTPPADAPEQEADADNAQEAPTHTNPEEETADRQETAPQETAPQETAPQAAHHSHAHMSVDNLVAAQALKDATMAWWTAQHLPEQGVLLHLNGAFHSDYNEGILWYLQQLQPELELLTLSTQEMAAPEGPLPMDARTADFIILAHPAMTKTH